MKKIIFIVVAIILVSSGIGYLLIQGNKVTQPQRKDQKAEVPNQAEEDGVTIKPGPTTTQPVFNDFPNDKDRDGIEDVKEKELGTSDTDFDSDGDGLSDQNEIENYKTNPKNKDTDGDGYADGFEVLRGFNPNGPGQLAPVEE